jgi:ABC-type bacteriocin/lantibiotic exporter with double-glycine peptidase domain
LKIFRQYDAGELTSRILAASQIQNTVFSVVNGQLLGSLFTTVSLIMMFYYSRTLAWWGIIMVLCYGAVFFLLARRNLVPLALAAEAQGRISGFLQQFFSGMNKVRSAGAEQQLVNRFMDDFSKMEKAHYQASSNEIQQQVFSSCFSMVISIIFYALAGGFLDANLPLPIFLAFMASFHNFKGGLLDLSASIWTLLAIKTEINRIIPILQEKPEDDGNRNDAGLLSGKVEVSHLKFSYTPDSPLVLDDVSLKAKPGEFIAIAGASGAGKSSLFRILLGFETPNSGAIYYSDQDFANLDRNSVRCQMGVIMQNSRIIPGSILENIIQGTDASIEEAWNALEMAEFADEVRQMPMDIHTIVTPATISGGQQQRILIARALVGNPKVILMDESTSALDNISQEKITKNLQQLAVTRIVIAHRLSTIVDADRIYVLDKGKVVQCGTYETLSAKNGVFKDLIERQKTQKD